MSKIIAFIIWIVVVIVLGKIINLFNIEIINFIYWISTFIMSVVFAIGLVDGDF